MFSKLVNFEGYVHGLTNPLANAMMMFKKCEVCGCRMFRFWKLERCVDCGVAKHKSCAQESSVEAPVVVDNMPRPLEASVVHDLYTAWMASAADNCDRFESRKIELIASAARGLIRVDDDESVQATESGGGETEKPVSLPVTLPVDMDMSKVDMIVGEQLQSDLAEAEGDELVQATESGGDETGETEKPVSLPVSLPVDMDMSKGDIIVGEQLLSDLAEAEGDHVVVGIDIMQTQSGSTGLPGPVDPDPTAVITGVCGEGKEERLIVSNRVGFYYCFDEGDGDNRADLNTENPENRAGCRCFGCQTDID